MELGLIRLCCAQSCLTLCDPTDYGLPVSSMRFSRQGYWSGLPFPSTTRMLVKVPWSGTKGWVSVPTAEGSLWPMVSAHDPVHTALVALSDTRSTPASSFGVGRPRAECQPWGPVRIRPAGDGYPICSIPLSAPKPIEYQGSRLCRQVAQVGKKKAVGCVGGGEEHFNPAPPKYLRLFLRLPEISGST